MRGYFYQLLCRSRLLFVSFCITSFNLCLYKELVAVDLMNQSVVVQFCLILAIIFFKTFKEYI